VKPDLLGLEISKGELRRLTGFDTEEIYRPSIMTSQEKRLGFFINEALVALALTPIIVGGIYTFIILPTLGSSNKLGIILLIIIPIIILASRSLLRKLTYHPSLTILLDAVDKYHNLVHAMDIHDQLTELGQYQSNINDREQIISALQLIREDLVCALKSERILRHNKKLLAQNQDLVSNLANLQTLQVSNEASEYGQLLNQSLQIALDVQTEIRKLRKV
jgi:hypothetical protein